jgi:hypothetical protein
MSRKAYPTGIVTKPGLKNNHLAILRATIEPEHQVLTFWNIFFIAWKFLNWCLYGKIYLQRCGFGSGSGAFLTPGSVIRDGKKIRIRSWYPDS